MKHLLRWAGFSAGYFGAVLLGRVLTRVEESSRAYELAQAEAAAAVLRVVTEEFQTRPRCLCSHCQAARVRA